MPSKLSVLIPIRGKSTNGQYSATKVIYSVKGSHSVELCAGLTSACVLVRAHYYTHGLAPWSFRLLDILLMSMHACCECTVVLVAALTEFHRYAVAIGSLVKYGGTKEKIEKGFEYKVSWSCCRTVWRTNWVVLLPNHPGAH